MNSDIKALKAILNLIKEFSEKIIIKKYKINYERIEANIDSLGDLIGKVELTKNKKFISILKKLKSIIKRELHSELFFLVGAHGGIIINDMGFCEFDSPQYAIDKLLEKMKLAIETNMPYNLEIAMSCLEWLKYNHPEKMEEFINFFKRGKFEIINPTYSQPYSLIIGHESNIKQFEFGFRTLKDLDLGCNIYYCSEHSLHPQIPQILKGFNINFGSMRSRLLGISPTTRSGKILWVGLDNTKLTTLTEQAGIYNGEYWHGTFFKEMPELLFQAISRPLLKKIIYSSVEDFVMPQPYQEEIWKISGFLDIFGKFLLFSEIFKYLQEDGEFKYTRDEFAIGDYIFIPDNLFYNNKITETSIICAEIINCILGLFNVPSDDPFFDNIWKAFLLTQAHDNYAVPFIRTGDYSAYQLNPEELNKLKFENEKIPISELSIKIQIEIQKKCQEFIKTGLLKIQENTNKNSKNSEKNLMDILVFNPLPFKRHDIFSIRLKLPDTSNICLINDNKVEFEYKNSTLKFIPEVPPLGYKVYTIIQDKQELIDEGRFLYDIKILDDLKTIEVRYQNRVIFNLEFQSNFDYKLLLKDHYKNNIEDTYTILGKIKNREFVIEITQYNKINRLEFTLNNDFLKEIILIPKIPIQKYLINYPFGIEETKRTSIQSLDFLCLRGEKDCLLYLQKNCQKFTIDRKNHRIRNHINSNGYFYFAIVKLNMNELDSIMDNVNSYNFKLLGIKISKSSKFKEKEKSFLSLSSPATLINLWRRQDNSYLRIFNPNNEQILTKLDGTLIKNQLEEIDFKYNIIQSIQKKEIKLNPWKIGTFLLKSQKSS